MTDAGRRTSLSARGVDPLGEPPRSGNLDLYDELVAEDYIQHNPHAGAGRAGLRAFIENLLAGGMPDVEPQSEGGQSDRLIAEGDIVVYQKIFRDGMLVDIFRLKDGKLQEHWDAYRPNPGTERWPGF